LSDPSGSSVACMQYVDEGKSRSVVFSYLVNYRYGAGSLLPVKLKGLDPGKRYSVVEIDLYPGTTSKVGGVYSGDFLMKVGINPEVHQGRMSVVLSVNEEK